VLQSSAPADVLRLTSTDYGTYVNKLSVEIGTGTQTGKRITQRFRQEVLTLDNLGNAFNLAYTGNGTVGTMTITRVADRATRLQTALTSATDGSVSLDLDLTQDEFATIAQLVTYLNGQNGYRAVVNRYANPLLPTYELDAASAATIRSPIAMAIRYTGAGSAATMTITNTALTTTITGAADALTLDLTAAPTDTLAELVAVIDAHAAYTCTLGPNADPDASTNALLTTVAGQDIKTATVNVTAQAGAMNYGATAALGSIVFAINSRSTRLVASRMTNATAPPANLAQTFLAGGTNPVPVLADWLVGLDHVATEDFAGGIMFPVSTDPVIQDTVLAWVTSQHSQHGNAFRAFLASPDNTTAPAAKTLALGMNTTFCTFISQPVKGVGIIELPPIYGAAMACGGAAGALSTQPITHMVLRTPGLPARAKYDLPTQEDLLNNGVCVLEEKKGIGVRITLAITTSLSQDRIDRMLSESMARDLIEQRCKLYVAPLIPRWAQSNLLPVIKGAVIDALESLRVEGVLTTGVNVQGKILPAYLPPNISLQGGLLRISVHVLIGGEIDHVDIDISIAYAEFTIVSDAA
jgi:hypothetical protein